MIHVNASHCSSSKLVSSSSTRLFLFFLLGLWVIVSSLTYATSPLLTTSAARFWSLSSNHCTALDHHMGSWCQINLKSDAIFGNISLEVVHLNKQHYRAKLTIQPKGQRQKPSVIAAKSNAIIGINAGYFGPAFEPVGLFKSNHKLISRFSSASQLLKAGISINDQGEINLLANPKKAELIKARSAMQIGPVLVARGKVSITRANIRSRRTILAKTTRGHLLLIITQTPVSLSTISSLLVNHPDFFGANHITTAVNLDGGSSSALSLRLNKKLINLVELKPVRTMLLFYPNT